MSSLERSPALCNRSRFDLRSEEGGMSYDELVERLRGHRYTDPVLQRLAEKAAHAAEADRPAVGR